MIIAVSICPRIGKGRSVILRIVILEALTEVLSKEVWVPQTTRESIGESIAQTEIMLLHQMPTLQINKLMINIIKADDQRSYNHTN